MDVRYLVLILLFLTSCMPTADVSKNNLASSTGTTTGTTTGGTTPANTNVTWNYLGALDTNITINVSNLNNSYIVGTQVETYLSTVSDFSTATYCLVSSYYIGGVNYELRSRTVPISYYDFKTKRTVRVLRVDFQDPTNSLNDCQSSLRVLNTSGSLVVDSSGPAPKYDPGKICPLCTSVLSGTKVRLFQKNTSGLTTYLDEISFTKVNLQSLKLSIDPNYSLTGGAGTCTNSDCKSRGYDCCLDNQCVQDGATRPSAQTLYSTMLENADKERLQDPLSFTKYPHLYYVCGSSIPTTSGGTTSGTTSGTGSGSSSGYEEAFAQLKKDYYCIEHLKKQATSDPFHTELDSKTYTAKTDCLTADADKTKLMYYKTVVKRLYATCGCNRTELPDMINNCPAYDYTVVTKDAANEPVRIDCYTPPTSTAPVPLQQSVTVPSRSAPHRFFNVNGLETAQSAGIEQEGDVFKYLDDGKVLPIQENFGMNSILGQMSVSLDQALPAKTLAVDIDQVYVISTTSGYYTPCPSCAKDSWLGAFSAFPSTSMGTGLQAIGHTTQRDSFSTNTTSGNYEDTIFGRACWLPPTMIPFSHVAKATTQEQRLNRLKTQASLFVNGYQRDWFGFNKGALIGSFDGVTWFAIGKGRIVRSTTKKLFLAINAPFADLASPTLHVVRVQAYDGITEAAQLDYDPQYHQYHPYQNEAGNCQKYHMCSTDTDCITKLGWEYACADVKDLKSNIPEFDLDAKEKANVSQSVGIEQILLQKKFGTSSTKRCVYRGAGALCHTNVTSISGLELNKRKLLTCAPNFFCSSTSSSSNHNSKIARFAAPLVSIPISRNHLFGKDANIAGRPLNYQGDQALESGVRQTLIDNAIAIDSSLTNTLGLCQPGKNLPNSTNEGTLSNPFAQHSSADATKRTDYIGQIGSCNSTLFSNNRHTSCPVLGSDGNYEIFASASLQANFNLRATNQNACGLESLGSGAVLNSSADSLQSFSPFRNIEAKPLNAQIITDPTLVRDACFRRAGAACHTDLDCSPNKLHADQVDFFGLSFFGNAAEKSYWTEYLTCGQSEPQPFQSNVDAFKNYDMSLNRCCREIGKDLTTYTSDLPSDTFVSLAKPYDATSAGLKMSVAPGILPNDPKRYSRLATVENLGTTKPILSSNIDRNPSDNTVLDPSKTNAFTSDQWKTLTEANSESCCGGGWVRKFSDGSNDWTRRDRVVLDVTNFRCINSRTPLLTNPAAVAGQYNSNASLAQALVGADYGDYCKDAVGLNGSCAQFGILDSASDVLPNSSGMSYGTTNISTINPDYKTSTNPDYFFMPRSADSNSAVTIDFADTSTSARRNIMLKIPSYVTKEFDDTLIPAVPHPDGTVTAIAIRVVSSDGVTRTCTQNNGFNPSLPTTPMGVGIGADCSYSFNKTTRILKVGVRNSAFASGGAFENKRVGVEFSITTAGTGVTRTKPGTSAYYLKRLGRLELTGIPQINYEILTCNDDSSKVIQGIFDFGITTTTQFASNTYSYNKQYNAKNSSGATVSTTQRFTNMHGLQLEPVFSANDFKCCSPLGKTVTDASKCCSGYGTADGTNGTQRTCSLPAGTNLMVYFNRFVSNEGQGSEQPGGGLVEADFDAQTGEPLLTAAINDKIRALGVAYCDSGSVRQGGAFGSYEPEPQGASTNLSSRIYNIVDSSRDVGQSSNAGTTTSSGYYSFTEGFRWNHHLYCDD